MAGTPISAPLTPLGKYPTHDNALGVGGFHIVKNMDERNNLWTALMRDNTIILVMEGEQGDPVLYRWQSSMANFAEFEFPSSNQTGNISFNLLNGDTISGNAFDLMPPLTIGQDAEGHPSIEMSHQANQAAGYYATLLGQKPFFFPHGGIHHATVDFDNIIVGNSMGIYKTPNDHGYNIVNTGDFNSKTSYLVSVVLDCAGNAPVNGYIEIALIDIQQGGAGYYEGFLEDQNGGLMVVRYNYKKGQEIGKLEVCGIVQTDASHRFQVQIVTNMHDSEIMLNESSCILIQEISESGTTSTAMQQYEIDTKDVIRFQVLNFGESFADSNGAFLPDVDKTDVEKGNLIQLSPAVILYGESDFDYQIKSHVLTMTSGDGIANYYFGIQIPKLLAIALRGKSVTFSVGMKNKDSAFDISAYQFKGDQETYSLVEWETLDSNFLPENQQNSFQTNTLIVTIPEDAEKVLFAVNSPKGQTPQTLSINKATLGVDPAFAYGFVKSRVANIDKYIDFETINVKIVQAAPNTYLRYTINADGPMPVGSVASKISYIYEDPNINAIQGSVMEGQGEGAIVFMEDGDINITTKVRLCNETDTDSEIQFAWYLVQENGDLSVIAKSQTNFTVKANTGSQPEVFQFGVTGMAVESGQKLAIRAGDVNGKQDAGFLFSDGPNHPLIESDIVYKIIRP